MSYTGLAIAAVVVVLLWDVLVVRTRLVCRRVFWTSYAIIVGFQLLTNGVLTGTGTVRYSGEHILGQGHEQGWEGHRRSWGRVACSTHLSRTCCSDSPW
jgi:hypothetical protein